MPDDESEGFTVRDRRRFLSEESAETAPTPQPEAGPAAAATAPDETPPAAFSETLLSDADEAAMAEEMEEGALPDVYSLLALFLNELRSIAWLRMGLIANPGTGQIERDLEQAKVAIDTVAFLADQLSGVVAPEERLPLRALVSDLQINYVEQSKRG